MRCVRVYLIAITMTEKMIVPQKHFVIMRGWCRCVLCSILPCQRVVAITVANMVANFQVEMLSIDEPTHYAFCVTGAI